MRSPKGFGKRYFSLAAILAFSAGAVLAAGTQSVVDVQNNSFHKKVGKDNDEADIIISKKVEVKEVDATFASEIYTQKDIKNSHSKNLYDFLNTQTSMTVAPSYGNPYTQYIDTRGYGIGNGYENIVITVNGRRLNNIDMSPQLLSAIPLENIKRIEILKGNGSVEYGDGANAGAINIITNNFTGINFQSYYGSHGLRHGSFDFGLDRKYISLSGFYNKTMSDGDRIDTATGKKNDSEDTNKGLKLTIKPNDALQIYIGKTFSDMDVKYANDINLSTYFSNPKLSPKGFTSQSFYDGVLSYGLKYQINDKLSFDFNANNEDKKSNFISWGNLNRYDYNSYNSRINYNTNVLKMVFGAQKFDGKRKSTSAFTPSSNNKMEKDNFAFYFDTIFKFDNHRLSLGARRENVDYDYSNDANSSNRLSSSDNFNAYEIGYNYQISKQSSFFINFNHSFQAPDIDRFFTPVYDLTTFKYKYTKFNGFIKPMKVNNYTIGYNYFKYPHKMKIDLFYADVKDEIYYNSATWVNTNLDKTKKYGLELEEKYNIHYNLYTKLNYSYIDTKIRKNSSNPSIEGNEIPGVSKHNLKLSLGYNPNYKTALLLSHTYRSKAYAMSDFDKSFGKMKSFNSTDFSINYKFKKLNLFAKINNIFDKKNALFVDSGFALGVYPTNFERTFLVGVSAKF